jgi:hypothetical protein
MITCKLKKTQSCYNPYSLVGDSANAKQVEIIHFFKDGEILCSTNRGWLCMYGSNNSGNNALESLEFRNKRKINLSVEYNFAIGHDVYINCNLLPDFEYAPDMVEMTTKENIHYCNRIYFTCGATDDRHEHLTRIELRSFMIGCYTRIVPTEYGVKVSSVVDVFKDAGVTVSKYEASKLLDNSAAIIAAVECES